jgi:topoisomerase-4 subunit A
VITKNGYFRIAGFDLSNHFEDNILIIEKFKPGKVYSAVYWDAEQKFYYVKRFTIEESEKPQCFINENPESKLYSLTEVEYPRFEISFGGKHKDRENEIIEVSEFIGVKSYKAKGKRLTSFMVENIQEIEPVIKKEADVPHEEIAYDQDDDSPPPLSLDDPAQMKLEL